jgi:hypothetical protein
MIADHEAKERFEVISEMSAEIKSLKDEIGALKAERAAAETRATKAEAQVKMLERQLTTPAREVKSLYSHVSREADQEKFDKELTRMTSAGWMLFDSGVIPGVDPARFVSLIRVAPIPVEPEKPAAAVAAAPDPVAAVKPVEISPLPAEEKHDLPVTRKTVSASAIIDPADQPAPAAELVEPEAAADETPADPRRDALKAVGQKTYEEALARNFVPNRPLSSFRPKQEIPS